MSVASPVTLDHREPRECEGQWVRKERPGILGDTDQPVGLEPRGIEATLAARVATGLTDDQGCPVLPATTEDTVIADPRETRGNQGREASTRET